jgi:hypothetical protein
MGKIALGGVERCGGGFGLTVVLCRPFRGRFMQPLEAAGLSMRYFHAVFMVKCGAPYRKLLLIARIKGKVGELHKL